MCFSSKAMDQQALRMAKLIQKKSIYKFVEMNFLDKESSNNYNASTNKVLIPVTKIILEDSAGKKYHIEPNANGLKFAEGKVTYKDYEKLERNEKIKGLQLLVATTSVYFLFGGTLIWYLY